MIAAIRARLVGREPDRGMTLVELMVTTFLLSTVVAIVAGGIVTATRLMGSNRLRLDEVSENKVAIEAITKTLRTAIEPRLLGASSSEAAFIQGDARKVKFYAAQSSLIEPTGNTMTQFGPVRISYTVATDGTLTETYQLPDAHLPNNHDYTYCTPGSTGCVVRTRVLARNLEAGPVFTFYGETQNTLSVPLSASSLEAVDSIDIVLASQTGTDETSTVVSRVSLVNAGNAPTASPTPSP
jgi:prepilin-type N-terminal cleavage/methylation domain-containing protein